MNCLFISCHASLEYYMCQIFDRIGVSIPLYDMDFANDERPARLGVEADEELRLRVSHNHYNLLWKKSELDDIDFIYLMNATDVYSSARYYAQFGKPVIVHLFGQYNNWFVKMMIDCVVECENVFLVCYSVTEHRMYYAFTADEPQARSRILYIPFGLDKDEFLGWAGKDKRIYTSAIEYPTRICCHHEVYKEIVDGFPTVLSGRGTQGVGGLGKVSYNELRNNYKSFRVYLTTGTEPAPYTLTPLEAMMTGCPTAIWDNYCGIVNEDILSQGVGCVSSDITVIREYLQKVLDDDNYAEEQSKLVRKRAIDKFDMDIISNLWKELIDGVPY